MNLVRRLFDLAVFGGAAYLGWVALPGKSPEALIGISTTFSTVAGTLLGFLIAALSIVAALTDRQLLSNMRRTGHYKVLINETYACASVCLVVVIVSVISLFVDGFALLVLLTIGTGLMALAALLLVASGRKFYLLISLVN